MLREHGTQRPTVFELLDQVHRMRGTKSRFTYHIPLPQPLSPRVIQHYPANPLDDVVPNRTKSSNTQTQPTQWKDTRAPGREKVLEATTTPMRRGRPSSSHQKESTLSHPPSPTVGLPSGAANRDWLADEEDKAWRALRTSAQVTGDVKAQKSGGVGWSAWKPKNVPHGGLGDISSISKSTEPGPRTPTTAFGDNFSWHVGDSTKPGSSAGAPITAKGKLTPSKLVPPLEGSRTTRVAISKGKDAFDGLGLPTTVSQAPTLGEARKLRTGLATFGDYHRPSITPNPSLTTTKSSSPGFRPTSSPRSHASSSWGSSPSTQPMPLTAGKPSEPRQLHDVSAESRFPSVEELDATFAPAFHPSHLSLEKKINVSEMSALSQAPLSQLLTPSSFPQRNVRSEQILGTSMRENQRLFPSEGVDAPLPKRHSLLAQSPLSLPGHHTATTPAQLLTQQPTGLLDIAGTSARTHARSPTAQESKDWLTAELDNQLSPKERGLVDIQVPGTPVLREFTKKRSSFIEENTARIASPQEGITGRQPPLRVPTPPSPGKSSSRRPRSREPDFRTSAVSSMSRKEPDIPSHPFGATKPLSRYGLTAETVAPPGGNLAETWQTSPVTRERKSSSSDEDSPEDALGVAPSKLTQRGSVRKRKGRQSSVHDLVDLWGGGVVQTKERLNGVTLDSVFRGISEDADVNPLKGSSIAVPSAMKPSASSPLRMQARTSQSSGNVELPRPPSRTSDQRRSPVSHTKQLSTFNSTIPPAPSSSHTRPQSLLLFPVTKPISDEKSDTLPMSGGLSVPQDGSRKNGVRRTSITDMVQRYEAINANVKTGGQGSSLPKPPSLKLGPQITSSVATARLAQSSIHSPSVSRFNSSRPAEDLLLNKDADKRVSPGVLTTTGPTDVSSCVTGLPNGPSSKLLSSSTGRLGPIDGLPSPSIANKVAAPPEEQRRSPSPEKAYQGVGKLIDQWQKKSEEAESTRSQVPRRGVARRAGLG